MKKIIVLLIVLCLPILIYLVLNKKGNKPIPATTDKEITDELSPIVKDFFNQIKMSNYQQATIKFDEQMKQQMPPSELANLSTQLDNQIGQLIELGAPTLKQKNNIILEYNSKFEKENDVNIQVVFKKYPDGYKISGLWFDSNKLSN